MYVSMLYIQVCMHLKKSLSRCWPSYPPKIYKDSSYTYSDNTHIQVYSILIYVFYTM